MITNFAVEETYPDVGRSMLDTFFPGTLRGIRKIHGGNSFIK